MVLSRPCHPEDQFTTSILRHWASKYDDTLGEHIKAQLIKNNNQPRKRQRYTERDGTRVGRQTFCRFLVPMAFKRLNKKSETV